MHLTLLLPAGSHYIIPKKGISGIWCFYTMAQHCVHNDSLKSLFFAAVAFACFYFSLFLCLLFYAYLWWTEPVTTIQGGPDLYIDLGSTINLTCIVRHLPEPPMTISWAHNNQVGISIRNKTVVMLANHPSVVPHCRRESTSRFCILTRKSIILWIHNLLTTDGYR